MKKLLIALITALAILTSCDNTPQIKPKLYMFAIGIGYDREEAGSRNIRDLSGRSDAFAIAEQIAYLSEGKMDYEVVTFTDEIDGFELKRVSSLGISTLKNYGKENITVEKLNTIISEDAFTSMPEPDDIIIFYFAGHGEEDTGDIVLSYAYSEGYSNYFTLSVRDLFDSVSSNWKGRKFFLLDSCYSGNFVEEGDLAPLYGYKENSNNVIINTFDLATNLSLSFDTFTSNENAIPNSFVITASSKDQKAYESNSIKHGYMTHALLKYLGYDLDNEEPVFSANFDGRIVTVSDLYNGIISNILDRGVLRSSTPQTTLSRFDMVVFDFR